MSLALHYLCKMIYWFDSLESTFVEAANEKYVAWDVVAARFQTHGRGQRNNSWSSESGKNLMICVVLEPLHIPPRYQFTLSQIVALAVADTLKEYGICPKVKWTNDIYVGDRKICGILLENNISGDTIRRSVVGIGVNINQLQFPDMSRNPTSMILETGLEFSIEEVVERLIVNMQRRYAADSVAINEEYNKQLYRLNEPHDYRIGDTLQKGTICGTDPTGELMVEIDGEIRRFLYGEISFEFH